MGYGAGHEIKVRIENCQLQLHNGKVYFKNFNVISWDMTHPMDGMTEISPRLIKIKIHPYVLTEDDKQWFKKERVRNNDYIDTFDIEFTGQIWSGYCRSSVENSFPVELIAETDSWYLGAIPVNAEMTCSNVQEFKDFIEEVLDFCPEDDLENEDGESVSFERQYEEQEYCNRLNYGYEND